MICPDGAGVAVARPGRGSVFLVVIGFLAVMLALGLALSRRFSGQAQVTTVADQSTAVRYLLESVAADVLWQIRRSRNRPEDAVFRDFRSGTGVSTVSLAYQPSPPVAALARRLGAVIGPNPPVATLHDVKSLDYDVSAWRKVGQNQEKGGVLSILCGARAFDRQFSLEVRFPFQVVLVTTPLLRRFILFFDQFHLEQTSPFGHHDQINTVAIRSNLPQRNRTPLTLYGWDFQNRDRNGAVFLGSDDKKIYLNLVGGRFDEDAHRPDLEDLWQISPSAFEVTAGYQEFGEEALLNDDEGRPLYVRGAGIPLEYRGHSARFGILGFSEEIGGFGSSLLGDFKLSNFLTQDPSFTELSQTGDSLQQASALRLRGNRLQRQFPGFARDIYGNVFARFFLLSFFEAPSVGSPIYCSSNPDQELSFEQYGNAQRITFKPVRGRYCNFMSRIVSGGKDVPGLGDAASVPLHRDQDDKHVLLRSSHVPATDGLKPANALAALGGSWFANGPFDGPGGRPRHVPGNVLGRVDRYFRTQADFKKAVGLSGPGAPRCWIDGVVYVHEPLVLTEGIDTADIRGGVVLVRGPIKLGNVARGQTQAAGFLAAAAGLAQHQVLTFVSLTGDEIALTGNRYLGVQVFSFRPGLARPTSQLSFQQGTDFVWLGGMGVSTPMIDRLSRQLVQRGVFPLLNFLPALGAAEASYTVNIRDKVVGYEFAAE